MNQAIKKASAELQEGGVGKVSLNKIYEELADFISETISGYSITAKTLRNYKDGLAKDPGYTFPQALAVEGLCRYLGYPDYKTWLITQETLDEKPPKKLKGKRNRLLLWFLVLIGLLLVVWGIYALMHRECWMQWKGDRYEEVAFDAKLLERGILKVCKEERLNEFRKVKLDTVNLYFDRNDNPLYWYGRNKDGKLELFTTVGLHPETGKTLKPITQYMIDKYLSD